MQITHLRHKLHLQRYQVLTLVAVLFVTAQGFGQRRWVEKNNPNYDQKKLSYGFLIGLHTTTFQLKYSDIAADLQGKYATLHSVVPRWKPGFSLGFIMNYRLNDHTDLRTTPKVAFYEHEVNYYFTDNSPSQQRLVETTMVELPILLKYKSERRGNVRMYMIGGVKPGIQASGQKEFENGETLEVKTSNLSLEAGFGFDLYYPLFKFSPEIRYSRGIVDLLDNRTNPFGEPLSRVNTNTLTIYFLFQ